MQNDEKKSENIELMSRNLEILKKFTGLPFQGFMDEKQESQAFLIFSNSFINYFESLIEARFCLTLFCEGEYPVFYSLMKQIWEENTPEQYDNSIKFVIPKINIKGNSIDIVSIKDDINFSGEPTDEQASKILYNGDFIPKLNNFLKERDIVLNYEYNLINGSLEKFIANTCELLSQLIQFHIQIAILRK